MRKGIPLRKFLAVTVMEKSTRPVSKAWYASTVSRLTAALPQNLLPEALSRLEAYMAGSYHLSAETDEILRLVFALLAPEIDKAMARSARARRQAQSRRNAESDTIPECVEMPVTEITGTTSPENIEDPAAPGLGSEPEPLPAECLKIKVVIPPLSRSERRRREKEMRRLNKQLGT